MKERSKYIPFEPARLDIIVPGTLILLRLMNIFGFTEITVSNYGLREGIILDMARKQGL
jgi:exopolyphosphatase/pppGpp-phosphohydrolase